MKKDFITVFFIFMFAFGLYVFTTGPTVVPYRDVGEMSTLLKTLGVAHPPGYPLYTLVGRLFVQIPMGGVAYRTNLFSGFFGAAALGILFLLMRTWIPVLPSLATIMFFGVSHPFWELANVSEMYTFGIFFFALLIWALFNSEQVLIVPFLYGLSLGVRMDLLLLMPFFLIWIVLRKKKINWLLAVLLFFLGLSIFLYLPIRSHHNPVLDWAHPDTLSGLFASMTRKSYGGTLDLLSLSYHKGENFFINLQLYGQHLWRFFGWWGFLLTVWGGVVFYRREKSSAVFILALLLATGPLYLFLANMPPNPHAMAIVEASYLPIDFLAAILLGFGVSSLLRISKFQIPIFAVLVILLSVNASRGFARNNKRENFYARDYILNVFQNCPEHAVGVFHKDVQLFSLWYAQVVEGRRPDVSLISTGLSGSPWFWEMKKRWGTALCPEVSLKSADGWLTLRDQLGERPLVFGYDTDLPSDPRFTTQADGFVARFKSSKLSNLGSGSLLREFALNRAGDHYGETPDFFSTDLIGDQARAFHQQGLSDLLQGRSEEAEYFLSRAANLDPTFARPSSDLGYLFFVRGNFEKAKDNYESAVEKYQKSLIDAARYKTLPDVVRSIKQDLAGAYVSLGGTLEKLGRKSDARDMYAASLVQIPNAQAHYNLGVTFWGEDWRRVATELEQALQLDPNMSEARKYYPVAVAKLKEPR